MQPALSTRSKKQRYTDLMIGMLLFAFFLRLAIGIGYYSEWDTMWYRQWALSLPDGLFDVYARADAIDLDYPPVYLFFLYILGQIYRLVGADCHAYLQMFLMKLWPILGDILCGLALYAIFRKSSPKAGVVAAGLWLFNPVTIFNSSFWGQTDQIMCLALLVSFIALDRGHPILAAVLFAIAGMTKFQCLFFTPVFLIELFVRYRVSVFIKSIGAAAGTVAAVFLPFMIGAQNPWLFFDVYLKGQGRYPHCTLNAFNIYGIFGLNWVEDATSVLGGISLYTLSMLLVVVLILGVIAIYLFARRRSVWVISFWFMNTLFLFMTRMHERYQFVVLIFLLMAAILHRSRGFFYSFLGMSVMVLINHAIPLFSWNTEGSFFNDYYGGLMVVFSICNLLLWVATTYVCMKYLFAASRPEPRQEKEAL